MKVYVLLCAWGRPEDDAELVLVDVYATANSAMASAWRADVGLTNQGLTFERPRTWTTSTDGGKTWTASLPARYPADKPTTWVVEEREVREVPTRPPFAHDDARP